jgi:hypothetical protein
MQLECNVEGMRRAAVSMRLRTKESKTDSESNDTLRAQEEQTIAKAVVSAKSSSCIKNKGERRIKSNSETKSRCKSKGNCDSSRATEGERATVQLNGHTSNAKSRSRRNTEYYA